MLAFKTAVDVPGVSGRDILHFMLYATDEEYRQWWPGVHLAFHTLRREPEDRGNLVFFDEYVGQRRLRFKAVVAAFDPGKEAVWRMRKLLPLPAWLGLACEDRPEGTRLIHTMSLGFKGAGRLLDPLLRLYCRKAFVRALEEHAHFEFTRLGEILRARAGKNRT